MAAKITDINHQQMYEFIEDDVDEKNVRALEKVAQEVAELSKVCVVVSLCVANV